jgi:hypothetical protein
MKNIISKTVAVMGAVAMFGWASMVQAAVNLPVVSSFDDANLPTGWTLNEGSSSLGSDTVEGANVRTLGELTTVTLAVEASSKTYANTWIQVFVKAQPSDTDPDVTGASGAFYVNNAGNIRVREGGAWSTITMTPALATNTWIGFVVHADYANTKWDLFCNRGAAWGELTNTFVRVNGSPLAFNNAATKMSALKVSTGKASAMDIVAVSPSARAITADTADADKVLVCTYPTSSGIFKLPVWVGAYNSPNNSLADPAAQHILSGLAFGDVISVFNPAVTNYGNFTSAGNGEWGTGPGSPDPFGFVIDPATAITLTRAGSAPSCGFFDYNDTTAYVEAEKTVASPPPTAPTQVMAGSFKPLQPTLAGLNELAWHGNQNETLQQIGTKLASQVPAAIVNGDRVYLAVNGIFIELYWNTAATPDAWYQGASLSAYNSTVIDRQSFWLARTGVQGAYSVPMGQ